MGSDSNASYTIPTLWAMSMVSIAGVNGDPRAPQSPPSTLVFGRVSMKRLVRPRSVRYGMLPHRHSGCFRCQVTVMVAGVGNELGLVMVESMSIFSGGWAFAIGRCFNGPIGLGLSVLVCVHWICLSMRISNVMFAVLSLFIHRG